MRVFVTGGAGFIGRHLVKSLLQNGHKVTVFDNLSNSSKDNTLGTAYQFVNGDITAFDQIDDAISGHDLVIHLAAKSSVQDSIANPQQTIDVNVGGTKNLLKACKKNKIKKIVVASSAAVYGDLTDPKTVLTEDSKPEPISAYGKSKLEMENHVKNFTTSNNFESIILRIFNVYGSGQTQEYAGVISKFIQNAKDEKPLVIYGDGFQTRDFVHVDDAVSSLISAISNISGKKAEIYNIASGKSTTVVDLANLVVSLSGKNLEIKHTDPQQGEIRYSKTSIEKAEKELGYHPKYSLKDGLENLLRENGVIFR